MSTTVAALAAISLLWFGLRALRMGQRNDKAWTQWIENATRRQSEDT